MEPCVLGVFIELLEKVKVSIQMKVSTTNEKNNFNMASQKNRGSQTVKTPPIVKEINFSN
jgi:hypothetical protein